MPRRRPANCAGFPAMLGPGGTRRTRSLRSLRHAAPLFPPGPALLGAIEAEGWPPKVGCVSQMTTARDEPAPPPSPPPSIAATDGAFRFRMSERRERSERSEFGTGRSWRETQGTGPEAAPAAGGPAASPGSVSWLLLGAPRSNSLKPAQPAAKSLLIPDRCVVADLHRPTTGGKTDMKVNGLPPHP